MLQQTQEGLKNDFIGGLAGSAMQGLSILGSLFLFAVGTIVAGSIVLFILDVSQTKDAVRRNYQSSDVFGAYSLN